MDSPMTKSEQSKKDSFWRKIPLVGTALKKWDFYKITHDSLRWHRTNKDPKELARTTPPQDENLELNCTWVVEAFSPSNIEGLIASLKNLGWDTPINHSFASGSLTDWIRRGRSSSLGSSWINGGIIRSYGDKSQFFGSDTRWAKLPRGVDYAHLSIRNITSSLTLVSILFIFDDQTAGALKKPFGGTFKTKMKYRAPIWNSKGATYIDAVVQKKQAIQKERDAIHANLHKWFRQNLPGYFSSLGTNEFPTVDLITSHLYEQSPEEETRRKEHYTDLLFDYSVEVWKSKTDTNLELRLPWGRTERANVILFGNFNKLTENNDTYGGKTRSALATKLLLSFDATMALWTTHNLLSSYESQLAALRDKAIFKMKGTGAAIHNLDFIRQRFLSISTDAQAVGNDIAVLVANKNMYAADALDFEPPSYYKTRNTYPDFVELLRQQAEMRTAALVKLENRVNETITTSGELTSAIANLRIQRTVLWFTIFAAILTLVSILKN